MARAILTAALALALLGSTPIPAEAQPSVAPTAGDVPCLALLAAGNQVMSLEVDGTLRQAIVEVPSLPPGMRPAAVIAFHGYSAHADQLEETAGLSPLAGRLGFVAAYPEALGDPTEWHFSGAFDPGPQDIDFTDALLTALIEQACVDPARILIAGHSMGGAMASEVACRLADRVAGVVLVAALWLALPCTPSRPVPVVAMHALDDDVLPYAGGAIGGVGPGVPPTLGVEEAIGTWADHDACGVPVHVAELADGSAVLRWPDCAAPVVLHRLPSGGHAWPDIATGLIVGLVAPSE
jgi:polyhydroxybutyrate depolymerase